LPKNAEIPTMVFFAVIGSIRLTDKVLLPNKYLPTAPKEVTYM